MLHRIIKLPKNNSFFLFGPRQTGKSSLINTRFTKNIWKVDLLLSDVFITYSKDPSLFRKEAEEKIKNENIKTIFIDEIQRIPILLNEIHYLIEQYPDCQFILTGSSARKLKRGGVNLLAGRAIERRLFPFTTDELVDIFKLEEVLIFGSLPALYKKNNEEKRDILQTYVQTYLREEIQTEGLVRNLGGFSRFLDIAASQFGELVNFTAIARECALPARTVQSYYEILEDTLIGFRLEPWRRSLRKRLSSHPKFYFFDIGVVNAINKTLTIELSPLLRGKLFEHFIILETIRRLQYHRSETKLFFWRTNHGSEVDLLFVKHGNIIAAVEIKSSEKIESGQLSGLRAFQNDYSTVPCFVVSMVKNNYSIGDIKIISWQYYLKFINDLL